jgi:hypothetical protein
VVIESLELNFDIRSLHDLVDFSVLLPTYELPVLIGQLYLESDLVMESLVKILEIRCENVEIG